VLLVTNGAETVSKHYLAHNLALERATTEGAGLQLYVTAFLSTIYISEGKESTT
jgi:hypothetical protein